MNSCDDTNWKSFGWKCSWRMLHKTVCFCHNCEQKSKLGFPLLLFNQLNVVMSYSLLVCQQLNMQCKFVSSSKPPLARDYLHFGGVVFWRNCVCMTKLLTISGKWVNNCMHWKSLQSACACGNIENEMIPTDISILQTKSKL